MYQLKHDICTYVTVTIAVVFTNAVNKINDLMLYIHVCDFHIMSRWKSQQGFVLIRPGACPLSLISSDLLFSHWRTKRLYIHVLVSLLLLCFQMPSEHLEDNVSSQLLLNSSPLHLFIHAFR